MDKFHFKALAFNALSIDELYSLLQLRSEVFVVEQKCVYQDVDGFDQEAIHVCGYSGNELVAYSRVLAPEAKYPGCSIGRVITRHKARGTGLGNALLQESIAYCHKQWPQAEISLSAQEYLEEFYKRHGFETESAAYMEDGIPHIKMTKKAG
jgi:ElaA protein